MFVTNSVITSENVKGLGFVCFKANHAGANDFSSLQLQRGQTNRVPASGGTDEKGSLIRLKVLLLLISLSCLCFSGWVLSRRQTL